MHLYAKKIESIFFKFSSSGHALRNSVFFVDVTITILLLIERKSLNIKRILWLSWDKYDVEFYEAYAFVNMQSSFDIICNMYVKHELFLLRLRQIGIY